MVGGMAWRAGSRMGRAALAIARHAESAPAAGVPQSVGPGSVGRREPELATRARTLPTPGGALAPHRALLRCPRGLFRCRHRTPAVAARLARSQSRLESVSAAIAHRRPGHQVAGAAHVAHLGPARRRRYGIASPAVFGPLLHPG